MSSKTRYFRVREGRHYDETNKLYKKGDIVKSEVVDLTEMFPNKFDEVTEVAAESIAASKRQPVKADHRQRPTDEEPEEFKGFGKDVTDSYPKVQKAGLKIYRNEKKQYFLVDPQGDVTKALNRKPLAKEDIADFVDLHSS